MIDENAPEPRLTGPALVDLIRSIIDRPVWALPRPEQTEAQEAIKANGRKAAAQLRELARAAAKGKARTGRGTCKGRPKFDHETALAKFKAGATPTQLATEYGVSTKSIHRTLNKLWPDRPKLTVRKQGVVG